MQYSILASSLIAAATVLAQPTHRHAHNNLHKRYAQEVAPRELKIEYETEWVTQTVWADDNGVYSTEAPTAVASTTNGQFYEQASTTLATVASSTSPVAAVSVPTTSSSVYIAPTLSSSNSVYVAPTTSSSSVYVAPTTSSVYVAPTTSSTSVYVAPTSSEVAYVAPSSTAAEVAYVAPSSTAAEVAYVAPSSTAAAASPSSSSSSSSSSFGETYADSKLTYYELGLGACGFDDKGKDTTDYIVALSHNIMGTVSNGNSYCGKSVSITANGKTITATIRDKCMGCEANHLDGSEKVFMDLFGSLDAGTGVITYAIEA